MARNIIVVSTPNNAINFHHDACSYRIDYDTNSLVLLNDKNQERARYNRWDAVRIVAKNDPHFFPKQAEAKSPKVILGSLTSNHDTFPSGVDNKNYITLEARTN